MSGSDTRRHLSTINETLRSEHNNLKLTKDHLLQHLSNLHTKEKQLNKLRQQLSEQLLDSQHKNHLEQKNKAPLCIFLKQQLSLLDKQYIESNIRLRNLQNEYQNCLLDYEKIVETVTLFLDGSAGTQGELSRLKESNVTMRAMIFDCQKLKRVLQEERRYFKQLCNNEAKGHEQRLKELQSIKKNIKTEADTSTFSIRLSKLHIGIMKLHSYFQIKINSYKQTLLRSQVKEIKIVKLGVATLENCLSISTLKMRQNLRNMFRTWHNNIFPKYILRQISQRALQANRNSKTRLQILGAMEEKIHQNNSNVLQLFQKLKFTLSIANKAYRKDRHYAFNKWRQNCSSLKSLSNRLEKVFDKILPRHLTKQYFSRWNKNARILKRIQTAGILLKQFQNTRQTARAFRKWRLQILYNEQKMIKQYVRRMKEKEMIEKRLNYQKRKVKILTMLHIKMTQIQLRIYFAKYWCNVKQYKAAQIAANVEEQQQKFSQIRKSHLKQAAQYKSKDRDLLLKIFQNFIYKSKIVPVYKQWRNESQHFVRQKRAVFSLVLRREAKNKIYVMNEFRKCVQYYEKKEMHQVLTDLNKKMQAINQKSTQFRQLLKNCIQNLGIIASKKINDVTNYTLAYQQKLFFNTYMRQKIRKAYTTFLIAQLANILQFSAQRQMFSAVKLYVKEEKQAAAIEKKVQQYLKGKKDTLVKDIFNYVKRLSIGHRRGFASLINIENVFIFYRLAFGFAAMKRKFNAEKYKSMQKQLQDKGIIIQQSQQNMINAQNIRIKSQKSLKQFFGKFITYENRKQQIKSRQRTSQLLKKYLTRFRSKAYNITIKQAGAQNISDIFYNHNQFIFFRNLMVIRYEQLLVHIKEQLGKINKKRKTFEEKESKIRGQTQKRLEEETKIYLECKEHFQFYSERYNNILNYYSKRTASNQGIYLTKQIFIAWKYEFLSVKRLFNAINQVFSRKYLKQPNDLLINEVKSRQNKLKSQSMIAGFLEKKANRLIPMVLYLWKRNIYKMKLWEIQKRIQGLDDYEESMKQEIKDRRELISFQAPRVMKKRLICNIFMAFKNIWTTKKNNDQTIRPMVERLHKRLILDTMNRWKWLIFYKHTKRGFISHMKQKQALSTKRDVFKALSNYRLIIYRLVNKSDALIRQIILKNFESCFNKIKNCANSQREQLQYARRRALYTLLNGKVARLHIIKRKILHKWNSLLIPRLHYLPSIIKRCELNTLKSAFAMINEKKYWNDYYIKNIAQQVTSQGYNQVNSVTNSLIREGYDPDEIKQYLKNRNSKDQLIFDRVIKHFKMWSKKQIAVRAFHSWKQYLFLKKNIKKALKKVFNIAGGIGKYWSRWRAKDPHFNQILKKQSRGNMLNRYRQLSRLLKEYHRDIRDNNVNHDELREINLEYKEKNKMGIMMALNSFSSSIKKGIRQGFYIWRDKNASFKRSLMDERYDQMAQGIEILRDQKSQIRYRIGVLREQNKQLKEKCVFGVQCGKILQKLLTQKDTLSINLADKQHNLKLLLEDNLRLKQKIKMAINNAQRLIQKVGEKQNQS